MIFQNNTLFRCDALMLVERLPSESVTLAYLDAPRSVGGEFLGMLRAQSVLSDNEHASYLFRVAQQVQRLLNDRGSLFVHWSPSSPIDMRLVINQAFGHQPRHEITWPRKTTGNMPSKGLKLAHDVLFVYCKSEDALSDPLFRPLSSEESAVYSNNDKGGRYKLADLTSSLIRPSLQQNWRGHSPPKGRSWRHTIDKLEMLVREDKIEFSQSGRIPRQKQYLTDHPGMQIGTTWDDIPDYISPSERTRYAGQTPVALMERIVKLASDEGDRVLDPFCGSGTMLIAAQSLGRTWWGADHSDQARKITIERLLSSCNQEAEKSFDIVDQVTLEKCPTTDVAFRHVLVSIEEISALQQDVEMLSKSIFSLKKSLNLGNDADEPSVEGAIAALEMVIAASVAKHSTSLDSYIDEVRKWLDGWDALDDASRLFLPQAELLFDTIDTTDCEDFSPFILQYCRALENELLKKLFSAYTTDFHNRQPNPASFLTQDLNDKKTGKFAKLLKLGQSKYTLGDMNFIMRLIKEHGETLQRSQLLQDFRAFTLRYFESCIVEEKYLNQIHRITSDFRNHAAHPSVLGRDLALQCRELVRNCINELILNYKGESGI